MKQVQIKPLKLLILASTLILGACSSGNDTNTEVTADTDLLVKNAIENSSKNIAVNLISMTAMANNSTVTSTLKKITKRRINNPQSEQQRFAKSDDEVQNTLRPTLEGGNASRTRNGNTIIIDPDESYVCQQWLDNQQQNPDLNECAAILAELTVVATATTDDTGTLSYLYSDDDLLIIQYAPTSASYELFLPGLKTLAQRTADVTGNTSTVPDTVTGAIKLSANIDNALEGREAGSFSVTITQEIQIASTIDNYNFELGRSTPISVQSDAATANGSVSIGVNAMNLGIEGLLGSVEPSVTTIELPEFTLRADIERSGTEILLSNVGMGRGPFRIAIDNIDVLSVALEKFSARYNDLTREADFLSAFNLDIMFNLSEAAFGWIGDDSLLQISASAPAGTLFTEQLNGSTQVARGGPFSFQASYIDGFDSEENFEQNILFTTGECFNESPDNNSLELVSCN